MAGGAGFITYVAHLEHRPVNVVIDQVVDRVLERPRCDLARKRHRQHHGLLIAVLTKPRHLPFPTDVSPFYRFHVVRGTFSTGSLCGFELATSDNGLSSAVREVVRYVHFLLPAAAVAAVAELIQHIGARPWGRIRTTKNLSKPD